MQYKKIKTHNCEMNIFALKKTFLIPVLLLAVITVVQSCSEPDQPILATVGDYEIYENEFVERYTDYIVASGVEDNMQVRLAILNNMINEILLKHYDDNEAVFENEEFKKEKAWTYKQALLAFLKDREVYKGIKVTDAEVREAFEKVNQRLAARHLYAGTEEEADELYELLQAGASFENLAKQVFTDSTLKNNGGYIGYFTWGDMDPAFEDAAYELEVGEISEPVQTRNGFSIIKLEAKEYSPLLTEYEYQTKRSRLENTLKIRKKKPSEREFIDSVFDREDFNIIEDNVKDIAGMLSSRGFYPERTGALDNLPLATYKDDQFYSDDILERIENIPAYHRANIKSAPELKQVIEAFIIQDELLEIAEEKEYDESKIMLDTYEKMLNNIYLKYKMREVARKIEIEDSTLRKYYEDNIDFFSTHNEVNIREIIVDEKKLAGELLNRLKAGESFAELAKTYSVREWSAKNGGEIGFAPLGKFGKFKKIFWETSVGEIVGPTGFDGYYGLFEILDKRKSKPIEFEEIKNEVAQTFREERQSELLFKHLNNLNKKVDISVRKDALRSLDIKLLRN